MPLQKKREQERRSSTTNASTSINDPMLNGDDDDDDRHHDNYRIALYYCYIEIDNIEKHVEFHKQLCRQKELYGRIRVSREGINGVLSGRLGACQDYEQALRDELLLITPIIHENDAGIEGECKWELDVKYCRLRKDLPVQKQLFDSLVCKETSTVVSLFEPGYTTHTADSHGKHGYSKQDNRRKRRQKQRQEQQQQKLLQDACGDFPNLRDLAQMVPTFPGGQHLSPQEWNDKLSQASNDQAIILDCRNVYESNVGYFQAPNASTHTLLTNTRKYSDLPMVLAKSKEQWAKKKQIFMYCTGGVRCEQASKFVQAMVAKEQQQEQEQGCVNSDEGVAQNEVQVYQLHGGIQRYLEHFHSSSWFHNDSKDDVLQGVTNIQQPETQASSCLYRGLNFVFDPRRTDPMMVNEDAGSSGASDKQTKASCVGKCLVCGTPHDDYDNGHAPAENKEARCCKCRILLLVCDKCRETRQCWGEDHKEELVLPKLYCGLDDCSDYQATGQNPVELAPPLQCATVSSMRDSSR